MLSNHDLKCGGRLLFGAQIIFCIPLLQFGVEHLFLHDWMPVSVLIDLAFAIIAMNMSRSVFLYFRYTALMMVLQFWSNTSGSTYHIAIGIFFFFFVRKVDNLRVQ